MNKIQSDIPEEGFVSKREVAWRREEWRLVLYTSWAALATVFEMTRAAQFDVIGCILWANILTAFAKVANESHRLAERRRSQRRQAKEASGADSFDNHRGW